MNLVPILSKRDGPDRWQPPLEIHAQMDTSMPVPMGGGHALVALLQEGEVLEERSGAQIRDITKKNATAKAEAVFELHEAGDYEVVASDARGRPVRAGVSLRGCPALGARSVWAASSFGHRVWTTGGQIFVSFELWLPCDRLRSHRFTQRQGDDVRQGRIHLIDPTPFKTARERARTMTERDQLARKASETLLWRPFKLQTLLDPKRAAGTLTYVDLDVEGFGRHTMEVAVDDRGRPRDAWHLRRSTLVDEHVQTFLPYERRETPAELTEALEQATHTALEADRRQRTEDWVMAQTDVSSAELRALTRSEEVYASRLALNQARLRADEEMRSLYEIKRETYHDARTGRSRQREVHRSGSQAQRTAIYQKALGPQRTQHLQLVRAHGHAWTEDETVA